MDTTKKEFEKFIKRSNIKLYNNLSDVTKANMNLTIGDQILFANDYGITFGPHEILGFCEPSEYGRCIYFEHDSYWFPCKVAQVKKVIKKLQYKDRDIYVAEDAFMQRFVMVIGDSNLYASIEDAKRVIRGEQPMYVIS